ncbi:MAG TPA: hypothetical protein VIC51_12660 [Psychromonas sp.]
MSLTKETLNDKIEVVRMDAGYPVIQVRTATIIKEDGVAVGKKFHRRTVTPGDDFLAEQDADVLAIIQTTFDADAQAAYAAHLASLEVPNG